MPHSHTPWWKAAPQSSKQDSISWVPRLTPVNVLLGPLPEKGKLISHSKPVGSGDAVAGDKESAGTGTAGEEDLPRLCREDSPSLPDSHLSFHSAWPSPLTLALGSLGSGLKHHKASFSGWECGCPCNTDPHGTSSAISPVLLPSTRWTGNHLCLQLQHWGTYSVPRTCQPLVQCK